MERNSKLAEIKLVTKHCSYANYSYPRRDDGTFVNTIRTVNDRTSLGSEGTAPGLIDDRSDSEASQEDEDYHANTSELWDSFWQPSPKQERLPAKVEADKHYPALIPPHHNHTRDRSQDSYDGCIPSWPLPDSRPAPRARKLAASYSAFPSNRPHSIQKRLSIAKIDGVPVRPPRPTDLILAPCLSQSPIVSSFPASYGAVSPILRASCNSESAVEPRSTKSLDGRPNDIPAMARRASMGLLRKPSLHAIKVRTPRHTKSVSNFAFPQPEVEPVPPTPQSITFNEPQSFFDHDDSDCEDNSKSFRFRFHKRGSSEAKPSEKMDAKQKHKLRIRADTLPNSPVESVSDSGHKEKPKRQVDVFGRILGRRSH